VFSDPGVSVNETVASNVTVDTQDFVVVSLRRIRLLLLGFHTALILDLEASLILRLVLRARQDDPFVWQLTILLCFHFRDEGTL